MPIERNSETLNVKEIEATWRLEITCVSEEGKILPNPIANIYRRTIKQFGDQSILMPEIKHLTIAVAQLPLLAEFAVVPPSFTFDIAQYFGGLRTAISIAGDALARKTTHEEEQAALIPESNPEAPIE